MTDNITENIAKVFPQTVEPAQPAQPAEPAEPESAAVPPAGETIHDTSPSPRPEKPPAGFVPHGALHAERESRREAEARLREVNEKVANMEARFQEFIRRSQEPEVPSFDIDPAAALKHQQDILAQKVDLVERREAAMARQQEFMGRYRAAAQEFAAKKPDFGHAYQHLIAQMREELELRGYRDPVRREEMLQIEEADMALRLLEVGENPAEMIYRMAQRRGYKAQAPAARMAQLEAGAQAAQSVGAAPGRDTAQETMTLQWLSSLEGKDFDVAFEKMKRANKLG
ncbi:MAG: hypothetical protein FJW38_30530 [Acidobacteria bacterium]|nr:hypothetical protein [Acidobacteriota bacterium]